MKKKLSTRIAETELIRFLRNFYEQYLYGKQRRQQLQPLVNELNALDQGNEEYKENIYDQHEVLRNRWFVLFAIIAIPVDLFVLYQATQIFCEGAGLPYSLAFVIPLLFIIVEILLSYFQLESHRLESSSSWLFRNLQYLIVILIGTLLLSVIVYSIATYSPTTDGSYTGYVLSIVLPQLGLFLFSSMLHIALIKYSEEIFEAFGFFRYVRKRKRIMEQINILKNSLDQDVLAISAKAYEFAERKEAFLRQHPDSTIDFEKIVPGDLKKAINVAMGRSVFLEYEMAAL